MATQEVMLSGVNRIPRREILVSLVTMHHQVQRKSSGDTGVCSLIDMLRQAAVADGTSEVTSAVVG